MRAYLGDIASMLEHADLMGHDSLDQVDLQTLRSWLAKQQTLGKARTTLARRAKRSRVPASISTTFPRLSRENRRALGVLSKTLPRPVDRK